MTWRYRLAWFRRLLRRPPRPTVLEFLADGEWHFGRQVCRTCGVSYVDLAEHEEAGFVEGEPYLDEPPEVLAALGELRRRRYRITRWGRAMLSIPTARALPP